jgi:drug/metabolite transporter (DMT)-like permease
VEPVVVGLLLVSAVLHAGWNVLLKTSGDPLRTSGIAAVAAGVVWVPTVVVVWLSVAGRPAIPTEGVLIGVASGVLEAAYFVALSAAYRRGDLSLVYPIARGSAPLLAVAVGVIVLDERLGPVASVGVACLLAGILALQRPWRFLRVAGRGDGATSAAGFALLTGVVIATYSAVDRVGTQVVPPWLYGGILFGTCAIVLSGWILVRDPEVMREPVGVGRAAATGILSLVAYLLVLVAFSLAPLTVVAPLRESAIVLASGWGAIRLGEAAGRREAGLRLAAAAVVVAGVVLIALD